MLHGLAKQVLFLKFVVPKANRLCKTVCPNGISSGEFILHWESLNLSLFYFILFICFVALPATYLTSLEASQFWFGTRHVVSHLGSELSYKIFKEKWPIYSTSRFPTKKKWKVHIQCRTSILDTTYVIVEGFCHMFKQICYTLRNNLNFLKQLLDLFLLIKIWVLCN